MDRFYIGLLISLKNGIILILDRLYIVLSIVSVGFMLIWLLEVLKVELLILVGLLHIGVLVLLVLIELLRWLVVDLLGAVLVVRCGCFLEIFEVRLVG